MDSKASNTKELMDVNNLKYEEPAELALVESGGVFKKNNADQQVYTSNAGTELICTLQSSTDFVYGPNCYLRFDVEAKGATTGDAANNNVGLGFLETPATALFERFLLEDKSGAEVERIEQINKAVRNILPWKYPAEYKRTVEMAGEPNRTAPVANATTGDFFALNDSANGGVTANGNKLRVCIPLWYFSGLFHEETLLPPQLISGMRFRLSLAPALEALQIISYGGAVEPVVDVSALSYEISDPVIVLDTYSLALSVQRNIQEQSQGEMGLPYCYESLYYQPGNAGTSTAYTQQVNKSVARAQKMWSQTQTPNLADAVTIDNLGSAELSYFQYQSRVGDWYAPQQTLQLGNTDSTNAVRRNASELYINNLQNSQADVCGMCMPSGIADPYHCPSIGLDDFRRVSTGENRGFAMICQNLNQSPHIGQSGIAVNNSRTAEVRLRYANDDAKQKQVQTWLQYVKVASVYPSRSVIKQ